ncbi:MAG TPA: hypothetical protein VNO54_01060 [Streptosporangiaceae bacterium]|nr:hypothetical protein [Streptosporangiaceae bacterium]
MWNPALVELANYARRRGRARSPASKRPGSATPPCPSTPPHPTLDQLEVAGIICPRGPAAAVETKRADQRPRGWDLAMHLVRDDLDDELAALEGDKPVRKCVTSRK